MKRTLALLVLAILTASAFAAFGTVSGAKYLDSDITTDTTWYASDSPIYITKTIEVKSGKTLTIQPGTNIYVDSAVTLIISGTLKAEGSFGKRINFTANTTAPTRAYWRGLYFGPTATGCTLDYCNISYADVAVDVWTHNRINVTRCDISTNGESALQGHNATLNVHHNIIKDNYNWTGTGSGVPVNSWAVACFDRTEGYIANNTITDNYDPTDIWTSYFYGIWVTEYSNVSIENNTIMRNNNSFKMTGCSGAGIGMDHNGHADIINNTIAESYYGILSQNYATMDCARNNITRNEYGGYLYQCNLTMDRDNISFNQYGLELADINGELAGCNVFNNTYEGVYAMQLGADMDVSFYQNHVFENCYGLGSYASSNTGIYLASWWEGYEFNALLSDNNVSKNYNNGVTITSADAVLKNNRIFDNGYQQTLGSLSPLNYPAGLCLEWSQCTMNGDTMRNNPANLLASSSPDVLVSNTTLDVSTGKDMVMSGSKVMVIASKLDYKDVYYADASSQLKVAEYMNVNVTYLGAGVAGAAVTIKDQYNVTVSSGLSNAQGNLTNQLFVNFTVSDKNADTLGNVTTEASFSNPFNISALHIGRKLFGMNITNLSKDAWAKVKMKDVSTSWLFWTNGHVVSGSETLTGKTILCGGDIYVPSGTSLDLSNSYLGMACLSEGEHRIQVNDTGYLNLTGTRIEKYSAGGYLFILAGTTFGANMRMDGCFIKDLSTNGMDMISSDNVKVTNNTILDSYGYAITISSASPYIFNNTLLRPGLVATGEGGINIQDQSSPVVDRNDISSSGGSGIYCTSFGTPTLSNNTIYDCAYGITAQGSSPLISRNNIHDITEYGISVSSANPRISNNTVKYCDYGIYLSSASGNLVEYNDVEYCQDYGIYLSSSDPYIYHNTIKENGRHEDSTGSTAYGGIYVNDCQPVIRYNTITRNPYMGINVYSFSTTNPPIQISDNVITNNGYTTFAINYVVYSGLWIMYTPATLFNNTISGNKMGLTLQMMQRPEITNSTVNGNSLADVLAFDSNIRVINTTMTRPYAQIAWGTTASIKQQNFVHAFVKKNGAPNPGANVEVLEGGFSTMMRTTDANAWTYYMPVTYRSCIATAVGTAVTTFTANNTNSVVSGQYTNFRQDKSVWADKTKTVTFQNYAPVLRMPVPWTYSLPEDTKAPTLIDLTFYVSFDPNVTGPRSYAILENSMAGVIDVKVHTDGRNVTVDAQTGSANDNWWGQVDLRINASDALGNFAYTNRFSINVTSVNDLPTWTPLPNLMLQEDVDDPMLINLSEHMSDADDQDANLSYAVSTYTNQQYMELYIYNKTYLGIRPRAGVLDFHSLVQATISCSDGKNTTSTPITISIAAVNDAPLVNHTVGLQVLDEDTSVSKVELSYVFMDPEGDQMTYSFAPSANFTILISPTGLVTLTPKPNWNGEEDITVYANDSFAQTGYSFHVKVLPINDPPKISAQGTVTAKDGEWKELTIGATDVDNEPLTFSNTMLDVVPGLVDQATYFFNSTSGKLKVLLDDKQVGGFEVTFTVEDAALASDSVKFRLNVLNVNEAPFGAQITAPDNGTSMYFGQALELKGKCSDPDLNLPTPSETLSYKWESNLSLDILGYGATLKGVLLPEGQNLITLTVSDKAGLTTTASVVVNVMNATKDTDGDGLKDPEDPDDDNDGMPDDWEAAHGLNQFKNDSAKDSDRDNFTNYEEFLGATDPSDPASHPPVTTDDDDDDDIVLPPEPKDEKGIADYWWVFLIIALVIIAGIVAIALAMRSKKRPAKGHQAEAQALPQQEPLPTPTPAKGHGKQKPMKAKPAPTRPAPAKPTEAPAEEAPAQIGTVPQEAPGLPEGEQKSLPPAQEAPHEEAATSVEAGAAEGAPAANGPEAGADQPAGDGQSPVDEADAPVEEKDPFDGLADFSPEGQPPAQDDAAPQAEGQAAQSESPPSKPAADQSKDA